MPPCLRISAASMNRSVYPFMDKALEGAMQRLLQTSMPAYVAASELEGLRQEIQFASCPTAEFVRWDERA